MSLLKLSAKAQARGLAQGDFCCLELVNAHLSRIEETDDAIGAYLCLLSDAARQKAMALDALPKDEKYTSPLWGVPFALKDNICVKGVPTTCASRMLEHFVSPYDATVFKRLDHAGAILLGKTNMDEFGMGNTTATSAFQKTVNPLDPTRVPGGSSGGSAAAVAALEAPFALGSDTGGSVRQPAAFCGLVGLKPTYGAVSRYGLVAFASSLEQIGPLARTVSDCETVFSLISGRDERDATSRDLSGFSNPLDPEKGVKGMRIGLPRSFFDMPMDKVVKEGVLWAAGTFEKLGATVTEVNMPLPCHALAAYYVISSAEASSNLARFDGVRYGHRSQKARNMEELYTLSRGEGFGWEVKKRILFGSYVLSKGQKEAYYQRARALARQISEEYEKTFLKVDLLLCPVTPELPFEIKDGGTPVYEGDLFTVSANLAGIPALAMPCKKTDAGLPVGMQLMAAKGREDLLFAAARVFEGEKIYGAV